MIEIPRPGDFFMEVLLIYNFRNFTGIFFRASEYVHVNFYNNAEEGA